MLQVTGAFSSFAVDDLAAARDFYGATLGLEVSSALPDGAGPLWVRVGDERGVLVYPKPDHVPATYTMLNFPVDDVDKAVDELTARGVTFLRYDMTDEKGVARDAGPPIAWFTDPAGNIISVIQL
jgi:catechol 2,3-dioxygenase-like lactoylglutathione lyase family enzyme